MPPRDDSPHLGARSYGILLALSEGERHGYDIMRQVALDSENELILGPATLYTSLKRLLELKMIAESEVKSEAPHEAQRRYYRLTSQGKAALEKELERSQHFINLAGRRLA